MGMILNCRLSVEGVQHQTVTSRRGGAEAYARKKGGDFRWWMPVREGLWKIESTQILYTICHGE
jgi:hypothetical protein